MARIVYKPLGLFVSVVGGLLAGSAFKMLWKVVVHDDTAPAATDRAHGWREVLIAATLQGALLGLIKAAVDRAGATGFERATGAWPGKDTDKKAKTA